MVITTTPTHATHAIPEADVVIVAALANAHPGILVSVAPNHKRGAKLGTLFA
jgi:prephenate dehydrogenase